MKIGIIGYGKMGRKIEEIAPTLGHTTCVKGKNCSESPLSDCDVLIDFSSPSSLMEHLEMAHRLRKNLVIGTTGWYDQLPAVEKSIQEKQLAVFWSPNFSIGVQLFLKLSEKASKLFKEYDVAGHEVHHREKKDAPSGTALAIEKACGIKVPFSSVRVGTIAGTHSLVFDSPNDTVTLTHQAKSRDAFAHGAIVAGSWLQGKKGIFTMEDMLA